ncbi:MAG: hypothetical protein KAR44_04490 [Candidatus Aegiribacteria sp.]|nr:hypothetical protein [Candidatus Aegiribacteria sp.]
MRYIFFILLIAGIAFTSFAGDGPSVVEPQHGFSTDDIILTSLGTWVITAKTPRGIDCSDSVSEIYITDYSTDLIGIYDYTGTLLNHIPCPGEIPDVAGICQGPDYLLINDFGSDTDIFKYQTGIWNPDFANPASSPTGMDMDATGAIWEIEASSNTLYRFDASGTLLNQWSLSEPPASASAMACTIFPINSTNVVMIGGMTWADFYFYEWDGTDLTFIGTHVTPQSSNKSYGAAWCSQRDTIFWVYKGGGTFYVCEFQCFITGVALERTTWGAIKATI